MAYKAPQLASLRYQWTQKRIKGKAIVGVFIAEKDRSGSILQHNILLLIGMAEAKWRKAAHAGW
jgi:hypothetical protein